MTRASAIGLMVLCGACGTSGLEAPEADLAFVVVPKVDQASAVLDLGVWPADLSAAATAPSYCDHRGIPTTCHPGFSPAYYEQPCEVDGVWCRAAPVGCSPSSCSFCWPDLSRCVSLPPHAISINRDEAQAACTLLNNAPCEEIMSLALGADCVVSGFVPTYFRSEIEASTACIVHSGLQLILVYESSSAGCQAGQVLRCDDGQSLGRWAPPLLW